jgi:hypothetical protein
VATPSSIARVYVPPDVCLTARALIAALRKMSNATIEQAVDALICELDARAGDPDAEPDPDEHSEEGSE